MEDEAREELYVLKIIIDEKSRSFLAQNMVVMIWEIRHWRLGWNEIFRSVQ